MDPSHLTTSFQLLPATAQGIPFTKLIQSVPFTPVPTPKIPPLIEKAGIQLQSGQADGQANAPLVPRETIVTVGEHHRQTNTN